ncbi:MAG: DNA polymerase III subunit gamma/tau, partial [Acidimicrobiaceae bacterium]|nr:DNA polymerase III subunit gamma/tau [Acidimicrobiaceae bacterium]
MGHRALYLRYRPKTFAEVKGQQHVVKAIQTAVREGRVGHAYLLHGPRGTGKTTLARLLAKALNCTDLRDEGEPCCKCESCVSIEENRSFDLHELDAASNNKVDDMRTLLERVNLVTPGRAKVYLLDEVHMLTPGAENALLKTLEEPPDHVTWVMATTEPHKVVATIKSRCQTFGLELLDADLMAEHVHYVAADANIEVDEDVINYVVSAGAGSVRDTLSALDGIAPGTDVGSYDSPADNIVAAIVNQDPAAALTAINQAVKQGRSPRVIGETVINRLRDGFLVKMGVSPSRMSENEKNNAESIASQLSAAQITRPLETLGRVLVEMRQAPDPRVDIEVAMVKLCTSQPSSPDSPANDPSNIKSVTDNFQQHIDRLEKRLDSMQQHLKDLEEQIKQVASQPTLPGRSFVPPRVPPIPKAPTATNHSTSNRRSTLTNEDNPAADFPADPAQPHDLAQLKPETPTQVVAWAQKYLNTDKEDVIQLANSHLPPKEKGQKHTPEELASLWKKLLETSASTRTRTFETQVETPHTRTEKTDNTRTKTPHTRTEKTDNTRTKTP